MYLVSGNDDHITPGLLHTSIPTLMSSDTQVLNMSRTSLTGLPYRVFLSHNLTNIQRLHISQSALAYIDDNVNLVLLNISRFKIFRLSVVCSILSRLI